MVKKLFVPPKLPPRIDYSCLVKEISQTQRALGQLDGLLVNVPNRDLLSAPLLTKEAVLSSRIEGTQATLEDVLIYEARGKTSEKDQKEKDAREIINYRRALMIAMDDLKKKPFGETLIRRIHYVLLNSVRGANKARGNLRKKLVYIASPGSPMEDAIYVPPPPGRLPSLLTNWASYLNSKDEQDSLVQIGIAHYQFEAIHPFMDGNGRIGRLLIPLFLYKRKLLSHPLLYISEYFEKHRKSYYELLLGVSENGDWENWLKYFLGALLAQASKAQMTVLKMVLLYERLRDSVRTVNSIYAFQLLDVIFANPIVSFVTVKELLGASRQTIYNLLRKFTEVGILVEMPGGRRNRVYVFRKLLEIVK